ncbi:hypothetical protein IKG20_00430 [Candidatus Saccharibacteria bacterium]|nr:hypothetical protein [Candidatus Saccharibacteria bacterium]
MVAITKTAIRISKNKMIDLHSHLLPAIDDGVETFEESLEILEEMANHGVTKVILTPHYIPDTIYNSSRADNLKLSSELQKEAYDSGIDVELHLGNEIYITPEISNLLKEKKISTLAGSEFLLIELPMSGNFEGYEDIFYNLQVEGYRIVLAHPERYISTQKDFSILERLHNQGILFQCNLGSIIGQYGKHAEKTLKKLAKKDLIFAFGTDVHHFRNFDEIDEAVFQLTRIYGEAKLGLLLEDNPLRILQ